LEKVQLEVARLITGLPKFTKPEALYLTNEFAGETQSKETMPFLQNKKNGLAPDYLQTLIPPTVYERQITT
jgi:hypothetical protein